MDGTCQKRLMHSSVCETNCFGTRPVGRRLVSQEDCEALRFEGNGSTLIPLGCIMRQQE
jgi:hypothetical protein